MWVLETIRSWTAMRQNIKLELHLSSGFAGRTIRVQFVSLFKDVQCYIQSLQCITLAEFLLQIKSNMRFVYGKNYFLGFILLGFVQM